jgi:tetratricopeptide (TPR) repeat protein
MVMVDLTLKGQCEEAMRLVHAGEPRKAATVCRRILQTFPKHIGTYSILGQTYLAMGQHEEAANLFRRVLGADPEHVPSYITLATIHERRGQADGARWHMERALELSPGDQEIRRRLRQLYVAGDHPVPARIKMTRAALARTYMRGQWYPRATRELRELVATEPQRFDLRVTLAESLWYDGQYEEAAIVCQGILVELPYCLKANLILGQIWLNTEKDEQARALLQRAQSLDPDNIVAQAFFGVRSPLPPRTARLPLRDEDAPAVSLPYLVDDEEVVAEGVIIEGEISVLPDMNGVKTPDAEQETTTTASSLEEYAPAEAASSQVADEAGVRPSEADELDRGQLAQEPGNDQGLADMASEGGLSLLDIRREYVEEHPDDHLARLDLARLLRESGELKQALGEYGYLLREDFAMLPEVARELELLNRLHPDMPGLGELLRIAREQVHRKPLS